MSDSANNDDVLPLFGESMIIVESVHIELLIIVWCKFGTPGEELVSC